FGALSYIVAQRTRELALRSALGAEPAQVFGLVFRHGLVITLVGLAIGVAMALATTRYLSTLLYGVSTYDVPTFVVVAATMLGVAAVACFVPALRAVRIDPISALRV